MNVEHIIMVIKLDIKTNIMANNKTITIEHIIGKLDNDFNPRGVFTNDFANLFNAELINIAIVCIYIR